MFAANALIAHGLRVSPYEQAPTFGIRDAELSAHAAFRKHLYDHDVVPDAEAIMLA